jgi:hypothetical protein
MTWKLVVLGGLAFYLVTFAVSMATGPLIHEGLLGPDYEATSEFWRPELNADPPEMAALMPRWISTGVINSLIFAAIFGCVHSGLGGSGWKKGLIFGAILAGLNATFCAGFSGVFNLPDKIWIVWGLEGFLYYLPGGAVLGWLHQRFFS